MKLSTVIFAAALLVTSLEASKSFKDTIIDSADDGSLSYTDCSSADDKTRMELKYLNYTKPVKKGEKVSITMDFDLKEEITSGEIKVKLNYGKIPIVDESLDLCDLITQISQQCPVKKGDFKVEITETLPAYIPSGEYTGDAVITDQNGKELACLTLKANI